MKIQLLKDIKGGPYVEFNISGDEEDYIHWCESSSFLDESIYQIFYEHFEKVSDSFNYYGPTMFIGEELKELELEFKKIAIDLNEIKSLSQLLEYLTRKNAGTNFIIELDRECCDWRNNFQTVLYSLRDVNHGLMAIIKGCINEKRVLWVLGI
jgi:hypothetical protein